MPQTNAHELLGVMSLYSHVGFQMLPSTPFLDSSFSGNYLLRSLPDEDGMFMHPGHIELVLQYCPTPDSEILLNGLELFLKYEFKSMNERTVKI